jgi:hypothetical protein
MLKGKTEQLMGHRFASGQEWYNVAAWHPQRAIIH